MWKSNQTVLKTALVCVVIIIKSWEGIIQGVAFLPYGKMRKETMHSFYSKFEYVSPFSAQKHGAHFIKHKFYSESKEECRKKS